MSTSRPPKTIKPKDLPLHCPTPDIPLWNQHPRVFLAFDQEGKAKCPYCGAEYVLAKP